MADCVFKVFSDQLGFRCSFQTRKILTDFFQQLIDDSNCHLMEKETRDECELW